MSRQNLVEYFFISCFSSWRQNDDDDDDDDDWLRIVQSLDSCPVTGELMIHQLTAYSASVSRCDRRLLPQNMLVVHASVHRYTLRCRFHFAAETVNARSHGVRSGAVCTRSDTR